MGKEGECFQGFVYVFDSEVEVNVVIINKEIKVGEVIVICYCGFKGGLGMLEMLKLISVIMGEGLGKYVVLIMDGCFLGGIYGFVVGYIILEVQVGGVIGLL